MQLPAACCAAAALRWRAASWLQLPPNPALGCWLAAGTENQSRSGAFNTMAATLAAALFLPQLLFGWDSRESLQLVLPLAAGWVLFDVSALTAVLIKLNMP